MFFVFGLICLYGRTFANGGKNPRKEPKPPDKKTDAPPEATCAAGLGFPEGAKIKERSISLEIHFCDEHYMFSCCSKNETQRVFHRWSSSSLMSNDKCASLTRQVLCSWCDGDVGAGLKSSAGKIYICPDLCNMWYGQCEGEYFSFVGGQIVPCANEAICSTLQNILLHLPEAERASFFCSKAYHAGVPHFEVAPQSRIPWGCFDGVPAAKRFAPSAQQGKRYSQRSTQGRTFWQQLKYDATVAARVITNHPYFPMLMVTSTALVVALFLATK